ncbi:hypothetical protein BJY01DRAFT_229095 [Aspergillus pseudoustus]|uniref:DUF7053 domain-containing protein n=1 Tax=Aspergillus pseudoustus TaxID=1810923 RepID=A0ABR4IIA9_9EURO
MNRRTSNTRTVSFDIPAHVNPNAIIRLLHNHVGFIKYNPVVIDVTKVETNPIEYEDKWFLASATQPPIETYKLTSAITILPLIGRKGQKLIEFETSLQSTENGLRSKADAAMDVSVWSHWWVDVGGERGPTLSVERTVECAWWLMPFVTSTYDGVHASVGKQLIDGAR